MLSTLLNLSLLCLGLVSLYLNLTSGILELRIRCIFQDYAIRANYPLTYWYLIASIVLSLFAVIVGFLALVTGGDINAH